MFVLQKRKKIHRRRRPELGLRSFSGPSEMFYIIFFINYMHRWNSHPSGKSAHDKALVLKGVGLIQPFDILLFNFSKLTCRFNIYYFSPVSKHQRNATQLAGMHAGEAGGVGSTPTPTFFLYLYFTNIIFSFYPNPNFFITLINFL